MNISNQILQSINNIKNHFTEVTINSSVIDQISLKIKHVDTLTWNYPFIYKGSAEKMYNYFLIFSALSFYYWGSPKWFKTFNGKKLGGSESLFFCLTNSINSGYDFTDINFINSLDYNTFQALLQGDDGTTLPLLLSRFKIIKEIGRTLSSLNYTRGLIDICSSVAFDASKVVEKLIEEFECFQDKFTYKGHEVYFYKKAQESICLINEYYLNNTHNLLKNINSLTSSSDYKLPQILISLGVLEISQDLRKKLSSEYVFNDNDEIVIEIRSLTILAVDMISKQSNLSPAIVSNRLWSLSQYHTELNIAYPKIVSKLI